MDTKIPKTHPSRAGSDRSQTFSEKLCQQRIPKFTCVCLLIASFMVRSSDSEHRTVQKLVPMRPESQCRTFFSRNGLHPKHTCFAWCAFCIALRRLWRIFSMSSSSNSSIFFISVSICSSIISAAKIFFFTFSHFDL